MIFGVILAGGQGTRMGNVEKPKQFLQIGSKPIIIHTVEKFIINEVFEEVIVLCPKQWIVYTEELLTKHNIEGVSVVEGGEIRNQTVLNAIDYIDKKYGVDDDTIMITHDAVRPFVTHRILMDNINMVKNGLACDTVIPATDTIVESEDGKTITNIPNRAHFYQGQTPQSFKAMRFRELYAEMSEDERSVLTDAIKVFTVKGDEVGLVDGETFNIKVTYPYDLQLAEVLLKGGK